MFHQMAHGGIVCAWSIRRTCLLQKNTPTSQTNDSDRQIPVQLRLHDADLKLLQVFAHVADAGGLSPAQYGLNMSLSAISAAISNLETRMGFRLCERGRGGFQLTEGGKLASHGLNAAS
ncbi:LysR family transcriptional regulator [Epibacterium sp. SM1969]|uniref:LysR family transcriptional regulator n=1 Tax=Tritonibacter aquimaris TaxID=2663379 RepID=A0A844AMW0_9RHOB|nr:LysR family transcriptional regulator [Tritonibacter aquimaris]